MSSTSRLCYGILFLIFNNKPCRVLAHNLFVEHQYLEGRCCCYFVRIMRNAQTNHEVVLYNSSLSPFGQRVAIGLKEKGISYKEYPINLFNKIAEFLALNPVHKHVSVLVY